MEKTKYSAGLVSQSFWFIEFKKVIKLLQEGFNFEQIKRMCLEKNLFGTSKESRAKRMYGYISNRAKDFDDTLITLFCSSNISTEKIMALIAILNTDKLFFEFMYEVYRDKVILGINQLEDSDINIFFKNKQDQNEDIAAWSDVTLKRLRSCYINYLTDAGLLSINKKSREITPPILDIALERCLQARGEEHLVKALTGVN